MWYFYIAVDCKWNTFGNWSKCDKSCGGGTQNRVRKEKISAQYGGKACVGNATEDRQCNKQNCSGMQFSR